MNSRPLASMVLCAGLLMACGEQAGEADRAETRTVAPDVVPPPAGGARDPRELPPGVPLKPSRAADPRHTKVIKAWVAALRAGDIAGASAVWAVPSKVQNGTPVLNLTRRADVRAFNAALPCGSVVVSAGGARGGFTIATVRLTQRRGGDCAAAAGAIARTAIRVRDGRIVEWYRLPDDPGAPRRQPGPPPDAVDSTTV